MAPLALGCSAGSRNAARDLSAVDAGADDLAVAWNDLTPPFDDDLSPPADLALPTGLVAGKASVDFGDVPVGETATATVSIHNWGPATSGSLQIAISGDGSELSLANAMSDCKNGVTTLAAGESCDITVSFAPASLGAHVETVTVSAMTGGTQPVAVTGNGTANAAFSIVVSPSTVTALANRETKSALVTVSNTGGATSGPLQPTIDTSNAELQLVPSSASAAPCSDGTTLAPGAHCDYDLVFTPTSAYTLSGNVQVDATPGVPGSASFTVQGLWPVDLTKSGSGTGTISVAGTVVCGASCSAVTLGRADGGSLQLAVVPALGSLFGGYGGACSGSGRSCNLLIHAATTISATFLPLDANVVFVSTGIYDATLGDPTAYDARCNTEAVTAGLAASGSDDFIAWVSSVGNGSTVPASNAIDRLEAKLAPSALEPRGFVLADGTPVADDLASWLGGGNRMFNSISLTALGSNQTALPWTGTDADGHAIAGKTCGDWTSASSTLPAVGQELAGPVGWTQVDATNCSGQRPIYCLMRTKTNAVAPPAQAGARRIWISGIGGATDPDGRCRAAVPAGVDAAKVKALVAHTGVSAASLLESGAIYVRPDNAIVGTGARIAGLNGTTPLLSGTWQLADDSYVTAASVLTGSGSIGSAGLATQTCNDWTSTASGSAFYGNGSVRNAAWWASGSLSCTTTSAQFYCIETP